MAYDSANGRIYQIVNSTVSVISDSNNQVLTTVNDTGSASAAVYVQSLGEIILNNGEVIKDSNNQVISTLSLGASTSGMAYDSETGSIYVTNGNGINPGTVTVVPVSSGTPSSASPTASASSSPTSTPKIPEFSNAALILIAVAMAAVTLCTVALNAKKTRRTR